MYEKRVSISVIAGLLILLFCILLFDTKSPTIKYTDNSVTINSNSLNNKNHN
jgi:hypothetical protein